MLGQNRPEYIRFVVFSRIYFGRSRLRAEPRREHFVISDLNIPLNSFGIVIYELDHSLIITSNGHARNALEEGLNHC